MPTIYVVTAIRLDSRGVPAEAKIRRANSSTNQWDGPEEQVPMHEVASRLVQGEIVTAVFPAPDGTTTAGPRLRHVQLANGIETAELDAGHGDDRKLSNLPTF